MCVCECVCVLVWVWVGVGVGVGGGGGGGIVTWLHNVGLENNKHYWCVFLKKLKMAVPFIVQNYPQETGKHTGTRRKHIVVGVYPMGELLKG